MNARHLIIGAAVLVAVGCGSSSKKSNPQTTGRTVNYSGSTAPKALTSTTDKAQVAGQASMAAKMMTGMSGMAGSMPIGAAAPAPLSNVKNALLIGADARHRAGAAVAAGAVQSDSGPCEAGGTVSFAINDQDGNPATTTAGDYIEISFAACDNGYTVDDGAFRLQFQSSGGDFVADVSSISQNASFSLRLVATNLVSLDKGTAEWSGMDGDMAVGFAADVSQGTLTYALSGTSFESAVGVGDTVSEAFLITGTTAGAQYSDVATEVYSGMGTVSAQLTQERWDLDARFCTLSMGGCINIQTNPAFAVNLPDQYPDSGAFRVSDDAGDFVQVTAVNGSTGACELSWSIDGQTGGPQATTWTALDAAAQ